MDFKDITLSEISQMEKNKIQFYSYMKYKETSIKADTKNKLVVIRG